MKPASKAKLANTFSSSQQLNKKVLNMKSSWDTVDSLLKNTKLTKKKPKA